MAANGTNGTIVSSGSGWTKKILAQGASSAQALKIRLDSWANVLTGMGTSRDKTAFTLPYQEMLLTPLMLEVLFSTSDIAARIVAAVPDECFREGWHVINKGTLSEDAKDQGETSAADIHERSAELESDFRRLAAREKMREAFTWGRLYGLGAILIGADDGQDPSMPLDTEKVKAVKYLTVLDKRDLIPYQWYADLTAPNYGDVATYQVQPTGMYVGSTSYSGGNNQIVVVHESRLVRFGGELTSKRERLRNQGSDYSVLQKCFRALQLTDTNWQSASALLADASQGVFKIKGLIDMISQQPDVMTQRMQLVDQMRSAMRAIILDADGEDFERKPTPFTGIPEMLDKTWERLASAARMPKSILMGTSPGSLNATGQMDIRWWYDTIAATQQQILLPAAERLAGIFAAARGYKDPENWSVAFAPLWQMTRPEQAAYELSTAQKDHLYIEDGVLLAEEVALSRFGSGEWSDKTIIDVDTRKAILEARLKQEEDSATKPPAPPVPPKGDPTSGVPFDRQDFNPDQPRASDGRWGEGGSMAGRKGSSSEEAATLHAKALKDGGFTYDKINSMFPKGGFAVSIHQELEHVVDRHVSPEQIKSYLNKVQPFLNAHPGAMLGAWHDAAKEKWYLDVTHVVATRQEATKLAKEHNQEGYYDLRKGKTVIVKEEGQRRDEEAECPLGTGPEEAHGGRNGQGHEHDFRQVVTRSDFSPDQPRAADGKWGEGGTASRNAAAADISARATAAIHASSQTFKQSLGITPSDEAKAALCANITPRADEWDPDKHPRVAAGQSGGGQFGSGGSGASSAEARHPTSPSPHLTASSARGTVPEGRAWKEHDSKFLTPKEGGTMGMHFKGSEFDAKGEPTKIGTPTPERQALHDKIMHDVLDHVAPAVGQKMAILTMGGTASGKSSMLRAAGVEKERFVHIDADGIKEELPEYREAVDKDKARGWSARDGAAMAHEESSYLAKQIRDKAIAGNQNLIFDGTGKNAEQYKKFIDRLHADGYHVTVMMTDLSVEKGLERAALRAEGSGRWVPPAFVKDAYQTIPRNFDGIARRADDFALYDNHGDKPRAIWAKSGASEFVRDQDYLERFHLGQSRG